MATNRMPWENHRLPVAAQRRLAAAGVKLDDEKVASYVKNRNDYGAPTYNAGRDQVDAYLNDAATSLYGGADEYAGAIRVAAYVAMKATARYDQKPHVEGVEALAELEGLLASLQHRVATLRAALGVRVEDDEADAALHRFSDALAGRGATPGRTD